MEYFCHTRALKNAKHLRASAPHVVPRDEPLEGYGSVIPREVLAHLHAARPPDDLARRLGRAAFPRLRAAPSEPLFKGSLVFVSLGFNTSSGSVSVSRQDLATAMAYARLVVSPISRYTAQYGSNSVSVAQASLPFAANVPGGRYNDQTLQGWVNAIAAQGGVPPSPCVVILNPPGVVNTDADPSQGVGGYHSLADVPYCFVNVGSSNLTIPDEGNAYALALSHEIAEMVVDPRADLANPEVCDGCGPNCQRVWIDYFDASGSYVRTSQAFPPPFTYGFYINAIVKPEAASQCPAPGASCNYAPP